RRALLREIVVVKNRLAQAQKLNHHDENIIELEKIFSALTDALTNGYKLKLPPFKYFTADKQKVFC
ncbi:MAG: hypothetical protein IKP64_01850, partial [Selenomonadaceae bacterium]|nr:hypothetical protein [Selenomonadaceae bacterium]